MSEQHGRIGWHLSSDQLPLLIDRLASAPIAICLTDTRHTAVVDTPWKTWARTSKSFLKRCQGDLYLLAPTYAFPDTTQHERIRAIIAEQLQNVVATAIALEARGIILPIEQLPEALVTRYHHYVDVVWQSAKAHNLQLHLRAEASCDPDALQALIATLADYASAERPQMRAAPFDARDMEACTEPTIFWLAAEEDANVLRAQTARIHAEQSTQSTQSEADTDTPDIPESSS